MSYWNDTITLYNKFEDTQTGVISWHRHTVEGCFVKRTNNRIKVGGVQKQSDYTIIRIPEQENYLPPHKWAELSANDTTKYMTLQSGDLVFLGNINDEMNERSEGRRSNDIIAKHQALGSVFIKSVNINTDLLNAHYYVRGE